MIRRLFWLTLGAALGVTAYRRAVALLRSIPLRARGGTVAQARSLAQFGADVREGMAEYMDRHSRGMSSTLEGHEEHSAVTAAGGHRPRSHDPRSRGDDVKDGR